MDYLRSVVDLLGKAFLLSGYVPAFLFVLLHQLLIFPQVIGKPLKLADDADLPFLGAEGLTTVLLPIVIAVPILALNTWIIKLFEGNPSFLRNFLLRPLLRRNQRNAETLYGKLVNLKKYYRQALAQLAELPEGPERQKWIDRKNSAALELQKAHRQMEYEPGSRDQVLPYRAKMVAPTALGNAFAVMEEYPFDRYGMDAMIFWPRLRPLLPADYQATISNQKAMLDLLINLTLLSSIFGLEVLVLWALWHREEIFLAVVGLLTVSIAYVLYQGAVGAVRTLSILVNTAFDFYRGRVLEQYGFTQPNGIEAEQLIWLRLGAFIRTGESFYHPGARGNSTPTSGDTP